MSSSPSNRPYRARQRDARQLAKRTGISYQRALAQLAGESARPDESFLLDARNLLYDTLGQIGCWPVANRMRCPLPGHDDEHRSATYTPAHDTTPERFWCWSCQRGGTILDLLALRDGVELTEAARRARVEADRYRGILPADDPGRAERYPDLLASGAERDEHNCKLAVGEYNLAASRVLDAHHHALDESSEELTGTCAVCGYADGWRAQDGQDDVFHYTLASVEEAREWVAAHTRVREQFDAFLHLLYDLTAGYRLAVSSRGVSFAIPTGQPQSAGEAAYERSAFNVECPSERDCEMLARALVGAAALPGVGRSASYHVHRDGHSLRVTVKNVNGLSVEVEHLAMTGSQLRAYPPERPAL